MRPVFVFGMPRSGTTLVQRLLNSYPDVCIWGEHHAFLAPVSEAFFRIQESRFLYRFETPVAERAALPGAHPGNWQNRLSPFKDRDSTAAEFRRFVDGIFRPAGISDRRFYGFKEIFYMEMPGERSLEFLRAIYPEALFAFVIRNPFNVLASWRRTAELRFFPHAEYFCERWVRQNRRYRKWHAADPARSFWIRYEELLRGEGDFLRLLEAMGKAFGPEQKTLLETALPQGKGSSFEAARGRSEYNERWKTLPRSWRLLAWAKFAPYADEFGFETAGGAAERAAAPAVRAACKALKGLRAAGLLKG